MKIKLSLGAAKSNAEGEVAPRPVATSALVNEGQASVSASAPGVQPQTNAGDKYVPQGGNAATERTASGAQGLKKLTLKVPSMQRQATVASEPERESSGAGAGTSGGTTLKLKLSKAGDVQPLEQSAHGFGRGDRGRGRGGSSKRGRGRKRMHSHTGGDLVTKATDSDVVRTIGTSQSMGTDDDAGAGGFAKRIKLSSGLSKIKLSLKAMGSKVTAAVTKRNYPGAKRGRKPGTGQRGRPPKKRDRKREMEEVQELWEDELLFAEIEQEVSEEDKKGPGRRPKSISGSTPATPDDISILIEKIWDRDHDDLFKHPVTDMEAPGYSSVITHPMDLGTIRAKNLRNEYSTWESVAADIFLMFSNALKYNDKDGDIWQLAKSQQMHARGLINNALQGKLTLNAKTEAANAARKETIAAKAHARAKKEAARAKARAEQRAAQEAKILKKAGVEGIEDTQRRATYRSPISKDSHAANWAGLGHGKSADGTPFRMPQILLPVDQKQETSALTYAKSLERFVSSLSHNAREKATSVMLSMFPRYYQFQGLPSAPERQQ